MKKKEGREEERQGGEESHSNCHRMLGHLVWSWQEGWLQFLVVPQDAVE